MAKFGHNTFNIRVSNLFYGDDNGKYEVEKAHWLVIDFAFVVYCTIMS